MKTQNYAITSGKFTANGNFTGYNALGERIHVHKAQMTSLKWLTDADVKFPFYAVGTVKQIGQLDEENKPKVNADGTPVLVDRLTAMSVYPTKGELIAARVDNVTLNVDITKAVADSGKAAGLTAEQIKELSVF